MHCHAWRAAALPAGLRAGQVGCRIPYLTLICISLLFRRELPERISLSLRRRSIARALLHTFTRGCTRMGCCLRLTGSWRLRIAVLGAGTCRAPADESARNKERANPRHKSNHCRHNACISAQVSLASSQRRPWHMLELCVGRARSQTRISTSPCARVPNAFAHVLHNASARECAHLAVVTSPWACPNRRPLRLTKSRPSFERAWRPLQAWRPRQAWRPSRCHLRQRQSHSARCLCRSSSPHFHPRCSSPHIAICLRASADAELSPVDASCKACGSVARSSA